MYTLIMAVLVPLAVVFTVLHYVGKKAIANGEYDKRGRRVVRPVQAPLGQLVQPAQVAGGDATAPDLPAELVQRLERAISQRVEPHLRHMYEQGVRDGVAECERRAGCRL